jgi:hypothetical protein
VDWWIVKAQDVNISINNGKGIVEIKGEYFMFISVCSAII